MGRRPKHYPGLGIIRYHNLEKVTDVSYFCYLLPPNGSPIGSFTPRRPERRERRERRTGACTQSPPMRPVRYQQDPHACVQEARRRQLLHCRRTSRVLSKAPCAWRCWFVAPCGCAQLFLWYMLTEPYIRGWPTTLRSGPRCSHTPRRGRTSFTLTPHTVPKML